ncbi:MAG: hypothetical protein HC806_09595, partial [Anaerolineae bacterium]|nr:hypothetical protein [Anaerolineae bacterium]
MISANPISGFQRGLTMGIQDTIYLLFITWADALNLELWNIADRFLLASWGWVLLAGGLTFLFLWKQRDGITPNNNHPTPFYRQAIPLGLFASIFALFPTWATDNQITVGLYSSRFALPSLFGVSVLLVGVIDYLFRKTSHKIVFLAICVGLSAGVHLRNANDFRWSWTKQQRFFWQLAWRVPGLENGTALFSDGALFNYVGSYPTSSALNTIYPQQVVYPEQSYWFVELDRTFLYDMDDFVNGATVKQNLRN